MPKLSAVRITKRLVDATGPGDCISDATVRGFRLIVSPAGTKRFVASYRTASGKSSMVAVGAYPALTVDQARERAAELLWQVKGGLDPATSRKALRQAPTLADLAEEYLGVYASSRSLSVSTVQGARVALRTALATLGRRKVAEITKADIRKLHGDARAQGRAAAEAKAEELARRLAAAAAQGNAKAVMLLGAKEARVRQRISNKAGVYQANRLLAVLSKMFSLAIERGWRADNPCAGVGKFEEDQRWRNLAQEEVARLLDACDAYEGENAGEATARGAADAIRLLLFTGARLREVLRAEWRQFDLEAGLWEKPSAHTKTKRQHRLELDGPALTLLREMQARAIHPRLLFPGDPLKGRAGKSAETIEAHPSMAKPRADLKRPWRWIARAAALEDARLHDLRRTTASFMLSGGASLATVGKALGHTQASTTARYAHLAESVQRDELRKAGERMAALRGTAKRAEVVSLTGEAAG